MPDSHSPHPEQKLEYHNSCMILPLSFLTAQCFTKLNKPSLSIKPTPSKVCGKNKPRGEGGEEGGGLIEDLRYVLWFNVMPNSLLIKYC